jgi:hypothetical protein
MMGKNNTDPIMKLVDSVARIETKLEGLVGLHERVTNLENDKYMVKGGWKVFTGGLLVIGMFGSALVYIAENLGPRVLAGVGAVIFKAH